MNTTNQEQPVGRFKPKNLQEVFALNLAIRLGDADNLRDYLKLTKKHPLHRLVAIYHEAKEQSKTVPDRRTQFWKFIEEGEWTNEE